MIDWQRAGEILEYLCSKSFFPGIGYENEGWEAWAFTGEPIEGILGPHKKTMGKDPVGALEKLLGVLKIEMPISEHLL